MAGGLWLHEMLLFVRVQDPGDRFAAIARDLAESCLTRSGPSGQKIPFVDQADCVRRCDTEKYGVNGGRPPVTPRVGLLEKGARPSTI